MKKVKSKTKKQNCNFVKIKNQELDNRLNAELEKGDLILKMQLVSYAHAYNARTGNL